MNKEKQKEKITKAITKSIEHLEKLKKLVEEGGISSKNWDDTGKSSSKHRCSHCAVGKAFG